MERRVFPCKNATDGEISFEIYYVDYVNEAEDLQDITCPVSGAEIPWDTAAHLGILGSEDPNCNAALEKAGMKPGVYTNHRGTWLILIHPSEEDIHRTVKHCARRLVSLEAFNTSIPELDVSACPLLKELQVQNDKRLLRIHGLKLLKGLTELDLSECSGLRELHGLEHLQHLMKLNLSGCSSLQELHGLEQLQHLTELDLSRCSGLRELPEGIRELKSLRKLDLNYMKLKTLPDWLPEIAEGFEIKKLWVNEGKEKANVTLILTIVEDMKDLSIFEQPYEVIAEWFKNRSQGSTRTLNEIKVVFLGDGEAGKSHTIARLMGDGGDPVDYTDKSTPGIVIKPYTYDGRDFRVHYWDFGGQEIMHSMHRIFLTSRTMYVVLLNARDDTQGDRAHYWLQNIQSFAPDAPVLLVLNKIDQNPKASVDERTLRAKYPGLRQIIRMSALEFSPEQFNREFRDVLLEEIIKTGCLDAQWPGSWIAVKERLEKMESHFILGDEYRRICRECQLDNVELSMLQYFNDLGVSFCFCGEEDYELEDHVILRPDWITNGLYIILFNQLEGAKNGLIPHKSIYRLLRSAHCNPDIRCTLPGARYDRPGDIEYVLGVMQKFDLSFTDGKKNEFIPMLCQQESTVDIAKLERDDQILEFNMEFEYLPENLLHRLMVERREELDMNHSWRRGAQFQLKKLGYSAVVFIDTDNTLRFFIRHTDPMHRPNTYLAMLKANVDRIVEKMGIKVPVCKLIYKLDGKRDEFDYEELKMLREIGQQVALAKSHRRMISIEDILNQSAPEGLEDEKKLLDAIAKSCLNIQGDMRYRGSEEDDRNTRIRDDLRYRGYVVHDQTRQGITASGKRAGELDLEIRRENNEPWTIVESLRINSGSKANWNSHLDKLVDLYNAHGLRSLYLITFADCSKDSFNRIWEGYRDDHIGKHDAGKFKYVDGSFREIPERSAQLIKIACSQYDCGGSRYTVYHIFLQMDPK